MGTDSWPYPGDGPLARARRVARAYRAALEQADPKACAELDTQIVGWGQRWMMSSTVTYDLDDWLAPSAAADIAVTSTANLRRLRLQGRLPGRKGSDGCWRYQMRDVLRVISETHSRRPQP